MSTALRYDVIALRILSGRVLGVLLGVFALTETLWADFSPDRAVMGEKYRLNWNAAVDAEIDARIEKHRKADCVVALDGVPDGTVVCVEQLTHDFKFGSHIFNFDQLGRDDWNDMYKSTFTNLWNAATVAFYWKNYEPVEGAVRFADGPHDGAAFWNSKATLSPKEKRLAFNEWRRPAPDPIVNFCLRHGLSVHGHAMIYGAYTPGWATNIVDASRLDAVYEHRIRTLCKHYGDRIDQWDVVNESVRANSMPESPDDEGKWRFRMPKCYTFKSFKTAEEHLPRRVRLAINDAGVMVKPYVPFIRHLLGKGARIDIIGVQMHIFSRDDVLKVADGLECMPNLTSWDPVDQLATLTKLSRLGRPIHISEITIPAPDDTPEGWRIQAQLMYDNYRLWFSWPDVCRITYWNLVDYSYDKESLASGLYTKDLRRKPSYEALDRLINREWKTRMSIVVNNGRIAFRGFRGMYLLSWMDAEGTMRSKRINLKGAVERVEF
ncbi:MAG TPA: endo-1,4-beta-xylanase [Kiritimatiellia bacterium]|jgi:GH35 family endo-1,4-beta-xylanase|nr:endo-1,4-beta-xylanase [Kiritimatiellia bacterium]HOR98026.1 endo-1,4-beta-xylanase [Kiritimatiellia bacterium]HPK37833.1 endo-1,4-beta-xylanase [Kiritimatiellia bacterium]HRU20189.1 endo-1,4-beta-xylanase [Kiritimatiellia bacterium]